MKNRKFAINWIITLLQKSVSLNSSTCVKNHRICRGIRIRKRSKRRRSACQLSIMISGVWVCFLFHLPAIFFSRHIDRERELIYCKPAVRPSCNNCARHLCAKQCLGRYVKSFKFKIEKDTLLAARALYHKLILVTCSFSRV